MASEFLGIRLNYKKHSDIIGWLDRFEDKYKSEEARRLLHLGIMVSRGEPVVPVAKPGPISWSFPTKPTVKEKVEKDTVVMNILGSTWE